MKRFALVALVAALLFGVASSASATELKVRGNIDVYGMWSSNLVDYNSDASDGDNYMTTQRMRTYFDYVANENLKAVLGLEMDNVWGDNTDNIGGDWGTDGKGNIEVRHAYLDFTVPDTTVNVQAGLQYVALPSVFGNPVFDDEAAAITVSAQINDMFGVAVGYSRGVDLDYNTQSAAGIDNDDTDMAFLAVPVTLDGFSVTPYFAYGWMGKNTDAATATTIGLLEDYETVDEAAADEDLNGDGDKTDVVDVDVPYAATYTVKDMTDDTTLWVAGFNAELTMFDPLTFAADFIYGQSDWEFDNEAVDSDGWYAALAASYKFDMLTATLFSTYFTGLDDDDDDLGKLPQLSEGWGLTPYIGGVRAFSTSYDTFSGIDNACWVSGLKLTKITFIDKLSHDLTLAYAAGTSDEDAGATFDEEDSAWEVYMVNKYMIYENLAAINELGFFAPDFDDSDDEDNSYFATVGFQYKF